jgi:hypothetical protein
MDFDHAKMQYVNYALRTRETERRLAELQRVIGGPKPPAPLG